MRLFQDTKTLSALSPLLRGLTVAVNDHALFQFSLRFPYLTPDNDAEVARLRERMKREVREAIAQGRVTADRTEVGLEPEVNEPLGFYAFTQDRRRVYAVHFDECADRLVVVTTMRP